MLFFTFLSKYTFGILVFSFGVVFFGGVVILLFFIFLLIFSSSKYKIFIIYGLILTFLNTLLNSVTFDYLNCENIGTFIPYIFFNRHLWLSFIGISFLIVGFILIFCDKCDKIILSPKNKNIVLVGLLLIWFIFSGWVARMRILSNEPNFTYEWQTKVKEIGNKKSVIININPTNWKYEYVNPKFSK